MSGTGMGVTESKAPEEDDPKTAISARTEMRHKSNQLSGGLGPKITDNLLNQELLISKSIFQPCLNYQITQNPPLNNQTLQLKSPRTAKTVTNHNTQASINVTMNPDNSYKH